MSYCNVPFPAPATQSHAPTLPGTSIDCACHQMSHWCCACHTTSHCNVPLPAPATQSHAPTLPGCFNHLPPNVALVLSRCNAHATYSLHQPPRPTLQRYQDASIDCACHQMSHWVLRHSVTLQRTLPCTSHPEPRSNATRMLRLPHNVTMQRTIPCTSHTDPRCNWKCHVYKRANFTCTSEPISRVQANPRPTSRTIQCLVPHAELKAPLEFWPHRWQ